MTDIVRILNGSNKNNSISGMPMCLKHYWFKGKRNMKFANFNLDNN